MRNGAAAPFPFRGPPGVDSLPRKKRLTCGPAPPAGIPRHAIAMNRPVALLRLRALVSAVLLAAASPAFAQFSVTELPGQNVVSAILEKVEDVVNTRGTVQVTVHDVCAVRVGYRFEVDLFRRDDAVRPEHPLRWRKL